MLTINETLYSTRVHPDIICLQDYDSVTIVTDTPDGEMTASSDKYTPIHVLIAQVSIYIQPLIRLGEYTCEYTTSLYTRIFL